MTEQEALDTAARADDQLGGMTIIYCGRPTPFIRAHAADLVHDAARIAELEAKLDALTEQHEAFKQEVSDAVVSAKRVYGGHREAFDQLERFIIPKPVDPLVEAFQDAGIVPHCTSIIDSVAALREALARRGLEIVKKEGV